MNAAARTVSVGAIEVANDRPFALIAGPCQIELLAHALEVAPRCAKSPPPPACR